MPRRAKFAHLTTCRNQHGTPTVRWRDPVTGRYKTESLATLGFKSFDDAREYLRRKSDMIDDELRIVASRANRESSMRPWSEIEGDHYRQFEGERGQAAARRNHRDYLKFWREFRSSRKLLQGKDLSRGQVREFRDDLASRYADLADSTRNRILNAVRALLLWAREREFLLLSSDDIKDGMKRFREREPHPRPLSCEDLRSLLDALVKHDQSLNFASRQQKAAYVASVPSAQRRPKYRPLAPFVLTALLTGARPGEVCAIRWEDVSEENGFLTIRDSKRSRYRRVELSPRYSPALIQVLKALKVRRGNNVHVCGDNRNGAPWSGPRKAWNRLRKLAKLPNLRPKDLRATLDTALASVSQYSANFLTDLFGHSPAIAKRHYRGKLFGRHLDDPTAERCLGIAKELQHVLRALGWQRRKY